MRQHGAGRVATSPVSVGFSRKLSVALVGLVFLMGATLAATVWMARHQDIAAQTASRQMVAGGLTAFAERTKVTLLDYAIWTDAYDNILAGDIDWVTANVGDSDAFDLVVVQWPHAVRLGWEAGEGPRADLLEPGAIATVNKLLDDIPADSDSGAAAYVRSGDALWFLAGARVVPQDGVPANLLDAQLPRLIIGFRVTTNLFRALGRPFMIENLAVSQERVPGEDVITLDGVDGRALGWVSWTPPTPGRAMLRATLWPLVGLMIAVAAIVLLVSRELLRSARRLEAALTQAQAADVTKNEFLSNVSHELRTPLTGIIGVTQLLQMCELDAEGRHMLDILLVSAHSLLRLVEGLLDITRIEAGAISLEQKPFDPAEVLEDTVRLLQPDIDKKWLALHLTIAPGARRQVLGDMLAFRQVATNLIGNALKFTDSGSITIELGVSDACALILRVSDTGVGSIPPSMIESSNASCR